MTELDIINQDAWEIAAQSMMFKDRKYETFSNKQIRGFFEIAKLRNFEAELEAHIRKYTPQPSRGQRPQEIPRELQKMKELNENIGQCIKIEFQKLAPAERRRFSQYVIWNIKIMEQCKLDINKIKLVLDCEKVKNSQTILDHLIRISKTVTDQSPRKSEQRERYQDRRR